MVGRSFRRASMRSLRPEYISRRTALLCVLALASVRIGVGQVTAIPAEADGRLPHFRFTSGEELLELRIHYRVLGRPIRDASGKVVNAVLILHGTGGSGANFIRPEFAGELYGTGQLLDASR